MSADVSRFSPPAATSPRSWIVFALVAVVLPTLIAYNSPPSATFLNQDAAYVGWGLFLIVLSVAVPLGFWPHSAGTLALAGALALLTLAALAAAPLYGAPWTLALSEALTIAAALFVVVVAASLAQAGLGEAAFRAFCIALVIAGVASTVIGLIQVFAPGWADGDWIASSAPGRATGNLRQPNHLSSLLLWSVIAAVWLGEARVLVRWLAVALALIFIYVIVLSASRTGALGMLTLAGWGLLDRRLSRRMRVLLVLAPFVYGAMWWGTSAWANYSHNVFGGQTRFGGGGDISSSRFAIWSNTLSLIAQRPWFGVGFGEFNFAWSLTPFPGRPVRLLRPHAQPRSQLRRRARPPARPARAGLDGARLLARPEERRRRRARRRHRAAGATRRLRDRLHGGRAQHARVPPLVLVLPVAGGFRLRTLSRTARTRRPARRRHNPSAA